MGTGGVGVTERDRELERKQRVAKETFDGVRRIRERLALEEWRMWVVNFVERVRGRTARKGGD